MSSEIVNFPGQDPFESALAELLARFREPKHFSWPTHDQIQLACPAVSLPAEPRPIVRDGTLEKFLFEATDNLNFRDLSPKQFRRIVRFPSTVVFATSEGRRRVFLMRSTKSAPEIENSKFINKSPAAARRWLRDVLVPYATSRTNRQKMFILGDPGAGKTTILKYLLKTERHAFSEKRVVPSRFEAGKFLERVKGIKSKVRRSEKLEEFLVERVLRDLILHHAYEPQHNGMLQRNSWCNTYKKTEELYSDASPSTELGKFEYSSGEVYALFENLKESTFDHKRAFAGMSSEFKRALASHLSKGLSILLIIDGLDASSTSEWMLNSPRYELLVTMLNHFVFNGNDEFDGLEIGFDIKVQPLVVVRQITFAEIIAPVWDPKDGEKPELKEFFVHPLNPMVSVLSAVRRGLHKSISAHSSSAPRRHRRVQQRLERRLFEAVEYLLGELGALLMVHGGPSAVGDIFNGNMRELFGFIRRIVGWHVAEVRRDYERSKLIWPENDIGVIAAIMSSRSRRLLKKRRYRLVEFLLFEKSWFFQTAQAVLPLGAAVSVARPPQLRRGDGLEFNADFDGIFDNIFNYDIGSHSGDPDKHVLLEKLRVLQTIAHRGPFGTARDSPEQTVKREFGFEISKTRMEQILAMLLRNELIQYKIVDTQRILQATPRARFFLDNLVCNSNYLEHIFHRTMMPVELLKKGADGPRALNETAWSEASILNLYVFLSYMRFVERNRPGGCEVGEEFAIAEKVQDSIVDTVAHICRARARSSLASAGGDRGVGFVRRILDSFDDIEQQWIEAEIWNRPQRRGASLR